MNIPSLIQNTPDAIREFNRIVVELGSEADERYASLIALYASLYVDVEQVQAELAAEGTMIVRPSGVRMLNPKIRHLTALRRQLLSATRALRLTPKAVGGKTPQRSGSRLRDLLERPHASSLL